MASGLAIHIEAGEDKHTEVVSHDRIRIGPSEDCNLRLPSSVIPSASGLVLELSRTNGHYRVTDFDPTLTITHNGAPLDVNAVIDDGDEVRIKPSNIILHFFPISQLPAALIDRRRRADAYVAPFIEQAALESAATLRRDDAKVFLREFTRELIREIKPSTKIAVFVIAAALVGGILYLGFAAQKELQRSRRLIDEQNQRLVLMKESLDRNNEQVTVLDQQNKDIIDSISLAPKVYGDYSKGVCLISGSYILVDPNTNRPLRYPERQVADDGAAPSAEEQPLYTTEGKGAVVTNDFVGTGFHVGDGYILTNRHVAAQPWLADERLQSMTGSVNARPRLTKLLAYFPGRRVPSPLRLKQVAQQDDLAVCLVDIKDLPPSTPALPLDRASDAAQVGKAVVMMGYPSGPDRMLALLPEEESRSIQMRCSSSLETLLGCLAERNLIKPLTTQGSIGDLDERRVVYDARTAAGGSGAPLFGQSGRVIGVNFAVFTENTASNFAVPIRYAVALLQRAGWKPKDSPDETPGNANTNQKGAAAAAADSPSNRPRE